MEEWSIGGMEKNSYGLRVTCWSAAVFWVTWVPVK